MIAALPRVEEGLRRYLWLQARVADTDGFHRDPEFRRRFNLFYRIRRGPAWQEAFYSLMARAKQDTLRFGSG
jgi:hypothetical protein